MPPPEGLKTRRVNARSSIANYVNNISEIKYREEEELYKNREPSLAKSKPWPEFLRLAISRQYLEKERANTEVEVRDRSNMEKVLLRTGKREKNFLGLDRPDDPRLTRAIANLDRTAREYAEGIKGHKSGSRHAHHERVEDDAPRGRSKRGEIVESHHVHSRHGARDHDAEPRRGPQRSITAPPPRRSQMPPIYEEGYDRTPIHGRRHDQTPPQEYVYPAAPPIPSQPSEPRRQDYQPSRQRQDYQPPPPRHDYQPSARWPSPTRSHLSSAGVSYMSNGPPPPAPSPPLRSEFDSHRADRLPERRESVAISASRSGYGYSNRPSDRQSEGRGSNRESLRDGNSHVGSWVVGSANEGSQSGRQRSRQSEVGHQSIRSTSNTHGDERGDTEAIVGLPNWGSGGDEGRVSKRREGRVSESDSRGLERSGSGS